MSRFRILILACCLMFAVTGPALAQDANLIELGHTVGGELTNANPEVPYQFEGTEGQQIKIEMSNDGTRLDPYLRLLGPDGSVLYENDDSLGNLGALVGPYTLPESGTYTIVATRCCPGGGGGTSGEYVLTLSEADLSPLAVGQTQTVALGPDQPTQFFEITGLGNQLLNLVATPISGAGLFTVSVTNTQGQVINQMWQTPGQPVIIDPLVLSDDGSYVVTVGFQASAPSEFMPDPVELSLVLNEVESQRIGIGETVTDSLSDQEPTDHFVFEGQAGDLLRLEGATLAANQAIEVAVVGPAGFTINGVSTVGQPNNRFAIDPLQLTEPGEHLLVVRRVGTDPSIPLMPAQFTLTLLQTQAPELALGQPVDSSVGGLDTPSRVFRFAGTEGQTIRISLASVGGNYAPSFSIEGPAPEGQPMGGGFAPVGFYFTVSSSQPGAFTYEVTLPTTGVYLFHVSNGLYGPDGARNGLFRLQVDEAQ